MAKLKLQTSKKKVNKKKQELEAPDEVTTHLQRLSEHLNQHFKVYLGGLAAIIVVTLAISWFVESRRAGALERSKLVTDAADVLVATVGEYDESFPIALPGQSPDQAKPAYETEAARWAAAAEKVKAAVDGTDDELKAVASALDARVKMAQGQHKEAGAAYGAFLEEVEDSALTPLILENQGHAAAAAGDVGSAAGHFEKMGKSENLYYQVRSQILLGDLYNPSYTAKGGDAAKAKGHYEAALKALTPGAETVLNETLRQLRSEIKRRHALLQG